MEQGSKIKKITVTEEVFKKFINHKEFRHSNSIYAMFSFSVLSTGELLYSAFISPHLYCVLETQLTRAK